MEREEVIKTIAMDDRHLDGSGYQYDFIRMTPSFKVVSSILIAVLILLAVSGNILTTIAYITDKRLHTVYDFYILNLAVTDLLIGCISMPFYAIYTLREFLWEFGSTLCKVWNVIDFTLCLESILLILLLSFDRLCLVQYGPFYATKVTKVKARVIVLISWNISFLLYGPAIIGWDLWVGYTVVEPLDCDVEFAYSFIFTTTAAVLEFIIPVVGLATLNILIYRHIRNRVRLNNKTNGRHLDSPASPKIPNTASRDDSKESAVWSETQNNDLSTHFASAKFTYKMEFLNRNNAANLYGRQEQGTSVETSESTEDDAKEVLHDLELKTNYSKNIKPSHGVYTREKNQNFAKRIENQTHDVRNTHIQQRVNLVPKELTSSKNTKDRKSTHIDIREGNIDSRIENNGVSNIRSHKVESNDENCKSPNKIRFTRRADHSARNPSIFSAIINKISKSKDNHQRIKRDAKAARFLTSLVLVFFACWAPYTVTTIVISFCGNECVNTSAYESMNWLLWAKSAINPFLYAYNCPRYRQNFKKYIPCWKNIVYPKNTETTNQTAGLSIEH